MSTDGPLSFDPFLLDLRDARLFRRGEPVPLAPKAFEVLCLLARNAGRLVTKAELLDAVWEDVVVGDGSLKVCIREIRQALGDDARSPAFIETVHRRGYRFLAKTHIPTASASAAEPPAVDSKTAADSAPPSLFGREDELNQLARALAAAGRGERQVVFVTGEAGGGKTSVVDVFLGMAERSGAWVASGQSFEQFGAGEAYGPFLEAFGRLGRDPRRGQLLSLIGRLAPTWLVQMPWMAEAAGLAVPSREILGATAERMLREACDALEALTADTTLVIALEDVHWSDYATVDLVSALARRGRPARLLLILTYRPVEAILADHPIKAVKLELQARRACLELPLAGLDEAAVAELLARRYPEGTLPDDLPGWLVGRTSGNPLFLVNLVEDMEAQGIIGRAGGSSRPASFDPSVPESVRAMVEKRVERLAGPELRVLEASSAAGKEFATAAVAAAVEADELDVEAICEDLARRHLILRRAGEDEWPDGTVATRYGFLHELYRDVIYGRLPPARRSRLHQKLGERLEAGHGDGASSISAELAVHFEQGRDPARAVTYLERAADTASRRFANREALGYLDRALGLAGGLAEPTARLRLLERRGLVRRASNDLAGAAADFNALAELARGLGRFEKELDARFYLASAVSWSDRDRCLAASDEALSRAALLSDPLPRTNACGRSAYWNLLWRDWSDDDARAIADAAEAARAAGDRAMLAQHACRLSYVLALSSRYDEACRVGEEATDLALELGDASEYLLCHFYRAWGLLHAGRWGELLRVLAAGADIADRNGHHRWSLLLRLERAWLHIQTFDFETALTLSEEVLAQWVALGLGYAQSFASILRGFALLGLGRVPEARDGFEMVGRLLDEGPRLFAWFWRLPLHLGLGECALASGQTDAAREEAERLCRFAARPGERTYLLLGQRLLAEVALAEGDRAGMIRSLTSSQDGDADLVSSARWRCDDTEARLARALRRPAAEKAARERRDAALHALAGSLGDGHPLAESLLRGASGGPSPDAR